MVNTRSIYLMWARFGTGSCLKPLSACTGTGFAAYGCSRAS